mmetsp:Transcript_16274/g.45138  ORF Transcript_16274/g.45138 Transcript_16274/m.45138 type:complete len:187 (-) Transcript_16274:1044-1604(-)
MQSSLRPQHQLQAREQMGTKNFVEYIKGYYWCLWPSPLFTSRSSLPRPCRPRLKCTATRITRLTGPVAVSQPLRCSTAVLNTDVSVSVSVSVTITGHFIHNDAHTSGNSNDDRSTFVVPCNTVTIDVTVTSATSGWSDCSIAGIQGGFRSFGHCVASNLDGIARLHRRQRIHRLFVLHAPNAAMDG